MEWFWFEGDYDLIAYVVFSKADYVYVNQIEPLARFFMHSKLGIRATTPRISSRPLRW